MSRLLFALCVIALAVGCSKKPKPTDNSDPLSVLLGGAKPGDGKPSGDGTPGAVAAPTPTRPALPAGWADFKHPEGVMGVYLPTPPQPKPRTMTFGLRQPVPVGRAFLCEYAAQANGLYAEFGVMIYSAELVDGVKAASERKGPVIGPGAKRASVTWCGRPAFEDTAERADNGWVTVQRSMWVGNRSYYCTLYGQAPSRPTAAERAAVFDSFVTD